MAAQGEDYGYDQPADKEQGISKEPNLPPYSEPPRVQQPMSSYPPAQAGYPVTYQQPGYNPMSSSAQQSSAANNTTVVLNQPQAQQVRGPRNWGTGICSCFDDMAICLCGMFCMCCLSSQVSQDMGEHCCVPHCVPGWLVALRLKMRTQENIEGTLMNDCCTVTFCGPCALCQLAREVKVVNMRRMTTMPLNMQY